MKDQPQHPRVPLQIQKPCPKSWAELEGDGKKRFCCECSLHVHNAAQLTQKEAQALVTEASERVCMRIQFDSSSAPVFRDSKSTLRPAARLARWALSAAAGVLAACHGSVSTSLPDDPTSSSGGQGQSKMGKVCSTELLGDVALPPGPELMGEAVVMPDPAPDLPPDAPPPPDDE